MTRAEEDPSEYEDRWVLHLRGLSVTRIGIDFRLTLALDAGWEVVLEGPTRLSPGSVHTDPGVLLTPELQDVAAAIPLFGATVLSLVAFKTGGLRMVFDDGTHLTCPGDPSFEAWQIVGPRGWRFISLPGRDLAVWSGSWTQGAASTTANATAARAQQRPQPQPQPQPRDTTG